MITDKNEVTPDVTLPMTETFARLDQTPPSTSPRGLLTKELVGVHLKLAPGDWVYQTYPDRKFKFGYLATEFHWYLRADNDDLSITEHAEIWSRLSTEGRLQSNYGEYLFSDGQLERCREELVRDRDSRRACVMILEQHSYTGESNDIPCTLGLQFLIRNDALLMIVTMRSQDLIFGAGNDWPMFAFTHQLLRARLLPEYPGLRMGMAIHQLGSLHVYQRHFDMLSACAASQPDTSVETPPAIETPEEAEYLCTCRGDLRDDVPSSWRFSRWLEENSKLGPRK